MTEPIPERTHSPGDLSCDCEGCVGSFPEGSFPVSSLDHVHEWQPNGQVTIQRITRSPVSRLDDILCDEVFSVTVCKCGKTKTTLIARNNLRHRGTSR